MPVVSKNTARKAKKRVAAYARVSTLMEEQEESYETQRKYYEAFIRKNPDWECFPDGFDRLTLDALKNKRIKLNDDLNAVVCASKSADTDDCIEIDSILDFVLTSPYDEFDDLEII